MEMLSQQLRSSGMALKCLKYILNFNLFISANNLKKSTAIVSDY
jgi:hypothetical protein